MQKCANLVELQKMLTNTYLVAKIGFDTAENEPAKNLQNDIVTVAKVPPNNIFCIFSYFC